MTRKILNKFNNGNGSSRQGFFKEVPERLLSLHEKIFGKRHLKIKSTAAVAFLVAACMSTMGTLAYVGVIDQSRYEVSGLTVKQNGTHLDVSWNAEDCDSYEVFLFQNGERPKAITSKTNSCKIELHQLDEKYKVVVTAKTEAGGVTGAASKKVYAEKIEQPIETVKEVFAGFEGNGANLKAEAPEKMEYRSSNNEVVSVNEHGALEYKKPGEAKISIVAEEGEKYKESEKTVEVTVFPDKLQAPTARIAETGETTVTLAWDAVDFAQGYDVVKKNPVDGEYDVIEECDGETLQVELPRIQSEYAVQASAEVEGELVESALSKDVKVKSPAEDAETYSSFENLRTLDSSTLELVADVNGVGAASVPQSMSYVNGNYVISYASHDGSSGALVTYDQEGNRLGEADATDMGHANGSTYNPNTDTIYTVRTHKAIRSPLCTTFKGETLEEADQFNLPKNASGIAYDETSNKYYLSKGNEIYVTDSDFNVEKFHWKKIRYNHAQDIGASNGVVLVCTWVNGNESYIDMYRASDGAYIGGYDVPIGEIESVLVVDKHLVLLMNNVGGANVDQIVRTIEPIALP